MSKYLNNPGEVPPKAWPEQKDQGFAFKHMETGQLIVGPSWKDLLAKVQRFYITNNFPIGLNFEQEILDQLCERLPASYCTDVNPNRGAEVPREEWPFWAKALALLAKPEDRGIGSVIERTIGPVGGDNFKKWYERTFQKSCGCSERRDSYDAQYPLNQ